MDPKTGTSTNPPAKESNPPEGDPTHPAQDRKDKSVPASGDKAKKVGKK